MILRLRENLPAEVGCVKLLETQSTIFVILLLFI
jgi:hypothetical protein